MTYVITQNILDIAVKEELSRVIFFFQFKVVSLNHTIKFLQISSLKDIAG